MQSSHIARSFSRVYRFGKSKLPQWAAKIAKVGVLITRGAWRRGLLHGVAATIEHRMLSHLIHPRTVIDIGANKGQFSLFSLEAFPGCLIFAFEPLPGPATHFRRLFSRYANVTLFETAIADRRGTANIHISKREDSSSLLPIGDTMRQVFPEAIWSGRTEVIRTGQLADFIDRHQIVRPSLLKLDVQGFELEALKGCESLLPYFDHVYVECSYIRIYEGQALSKDIEASLALHGFRPVTRLNQVDRDGIGPVQCDILFERAGKTGSPNTP